MDLIISENDIPKVVKVLGEIGFKLPNGYKNYLSNNLLGKYCRFVAHELTMYRDKGYQRQFLDLRGDFQIFLMRNKCLKMCLLINRC